MSDENRWSKFAESTSKDDKQTKAPTYTKSFSNPGMYPEIAKPRVVREKKDFTPEELEAIRVRLLNDPKLARQREELATLGKLKKNNDGKAS